jgi:hypothetical protein
MFSVIKIGGMENQEDSAPWPRTTQTVEQENAHNAVERRTIILGPNRSIERIGLTARTEVVDILHSSGVTVVAWVKVASSNGAPFKFLLCPRPTSGDRRRRSASPLSELSMPAATFASGGDAGRGLHRENPHRF